MLKLLDNFLLARLYDDWLVRFIAHHVFCDYLGELWNKGWLLLVESLGLSALSLLKLVLQHCVEIKSFLQFVFVQRDSLLHFVQIHCRHGSLVRLRDPLIAFDQPSCVLLALCDTEHHFVLLHQDVPLFDFV